MRQIILWLNLDESELHVQSTGSVVDIVLTKDEAVDLYEMLPEFIAKMKDEE